MLRALDTECNLKYQICPKCGARGRFTSHGSYKRHLVQLMLDTPQDTIVEIKRVRCASCNATHAIIPFDVVPYCQHSTTLAARLFELRDLAKQTVAAIVDILSLSVTTYYRITKRSLGRLLTCAGVLKASSFGELFKDTQKLVVSHLFHLRIKPFESGRLTPAFYDT